MIPRLTANLNNVQGLADEPINILPQDLKAIYDKAGNDIKTYLNALQVYTVSEVDVIMAGLTQGQILDGTITDVKLSNMQGQIKETFNSLISDIVTTSTANKILRLNSNNKLPANITGSADGDISKSLLTAIGDIIYASDVGVASRLARGTNNQLLGLTSGLPSWVDKLTTKTIENFPGNNIIYTNAGIYTTIPNTYVLAFTVTMNISGNVRFSFEHKIANSSDTSYYSLTVNGVERQANTTSSTVYILQSFDISIKVGDIIQLLHKSAFGTFPSSIQNFKIGIAGGAV